MFEIARRCFRPRAVGSNGEACRKGHETLRALRSMRSAIPIHQQTEKKRSERRAHPLDGDHRSAKLLRELHVLRREQEYSMSHLLSGEKWESTAVSQFRQVSRDSWRGFVTQELRSATHRKKRVLHLIRSAWTAHVGAKNKATTPPKKIECMALHVEDKGINKCR